MFSARYVYVSSLVYVLCEVSYKVLIQIFGDQTISIIQEMHLSHSDKWEIESEFSKFTCVTFNISLSLHLTVSRIHMRSKPNETNCVHYNCNRYAYHLLKTSRQSVMPLHLTDLLLSLIILPVNTYSSASKCQLIEKTRARFTYQHVYKPFNIIVPSQYKL